MKIITPEVKNDLSKEVTTDVKHLEKKSNDELSQVLSKLGDLKVSERGPERNRFFANRLSITSPYEKHCTSLLFLSGGTEITSPSQPLSRFQFAEGPDARISYHHGSPVSHMRDSHDDLEEILKYKDGENEAYYNEIQKIVRKLDDNTLLQQEQQPEEGPDILDDILDLESEKQSKKNIISIAPSHLILPVTCFSAFGNTPVVKNCNRKLQLICAKGDLPTNLQNQVTEKTISEKKKDATKEKYHLKFLKYDRDIGLSSRDEENRTILIVNIMNKKAGFAIYLVNKMKNCFQRKQLTKLKGIENVESYINMADNQGKTALFYAALYNLPDVVKCLVELNADPTMKDSTYGDTPLHVAARRGTRYLDVVKELCKAPNLNVDACNNSSRTALHTAVENHGNFHDDNREKTYERIDSRETVRHLLCKRGKLTVQDKDGKTPLHVAVERCNREMIGVLHQYSGGDWYEAVDLGEKDGLTALHVAAMLPVDDKLQKQVIMELLSRGAKSTAKDSLGRIPVQLVSPERNDIVHSLGLMWSDPFWQNIHLSA